MKINIYPEINAKKITNHTYELCTLSPESIKTLNCFIIAIAPNKLEPINFKLKFYKLSEKQKSYYEWVKFNEDNGYSYIISELCSHNMPFFNIDACCYACREWFGCKESTEKVYI